MRYREIVCHIAVYDRNVSTAYEEIRDGFAYLRPLQKLQLSTGLSRLRL